MAKKTGLTTLGFIIKQDSKNILKKPLGANVIAFTAAPRFNQPIAMLASEEMIDSFDELDQIPDALPAGEFEFTIYLKLEGTGATETYSLLPHTSARPVYSIFFRTGDGFVKQINDAVFRTVNIVRVRKGQDSILKATFTGGYNLERRMGKTVTVAGSTTTVINLAAGTAKFFDAGGYVDIGANTGLLVDSVDTTADTLTLAVALGAAPAADVNVSGHIPAAVHSGNKISGWRGIAEYGGVPFPHTRMEFNVANDIEILDDEVTGTNAPEDFLEGQNKRMVTISSQVYFNNTSVGGMDAWHDALNQTRKTLVVPIGDEADNIVEISVPRAELTSTPELDISGKIFLNRNWKGFASAALNDSVTITTDSPMPAGPRACLEGVMGAVA